MTSDAPYFDPVALRHELTAIYNADGDPANVRPQIVERLKMLVRDAHEAARANLEADKNGRACAAGLSLFQDELISLAFDYTATHVYRATNPSDAERMSVIATGGYGRALLAPGSDIDLLFLLPYKQTPWGESVAEYILYLLWDLGFKVGHATRTVDQCVRLSKSDITIRTALLDSRLILGDKQLFAELEDRFYSQVVAGTAREFIDAKMAERDERLKKGGTSRYRVEPNIKDGKGGLRDLHTLHWLSMYIFRQGVGDAAVKAGIFTRKEALSFRRCEDFLWSVRCFLHFVTNRPEEVLSFDVQPILAGKIGYNTHSGLRAVERFMKHYFLVAKEVGDLTTILCGALEMQQLKTAPALSRLLTPSSWRSRNEVRTRTDFRVENDRLSIADENAFVRDPLNLLRIFTQAELTGGFLHPFAVRRLRQSGRLIDDTLRKDPEANRLFLEVLTKSSNPENMLRRMNTAGVLGKFIPEFGRVVAMMQFNMYHHYTVDEHLLRTVGNLTEIETGAQADELPLSSRIFPSIRNRRALLVAAFLHDIGKGRTEDHSVVGARIARKLCPRFGLTEAETDLVTWLIQEHLTMSNFAHQRDISDPKTVEDFAKIVQSPERLKLLFLLTVADIRAVGPGVWNGWKGQLLRTLYYETEARVSGGHTDVRRKDRIQAAKNELKAALSDWPEAEVDAFIARHYPNYWLRTDLATRIKHAKLLKKAASQRTKLATSADTDAFNAITELTVFCPNHPRLLSLFAGACAASGSNIAGAQVTTTRDGYALDTFLLNRHFPDEADELRRTRKIVETIDQVLNGRMRLMTLLKEKRAAARASAAFTVAPEVVISNALSEELTVIEVTGRDRIGLLHDLTNALSDLSLDITSAHVTTFGEKAVDVFYVTDLVGKKITNERRQAAISEHLIAVLRGEGQSKTMSGVVTRPSTPRTRAKHETL